MERTEVDICNAALAYCIQPSIQALTEKGPGAQYCKLFYAQSRDSLLRKFDWPHARTFADGVPATYAATATWNYAYVRPHDAVAIRRIGPAVRRGPRVPFTLGRLPDGSQAIFTNASPAGLVYTARVEDPAFFDDLFADTLALVLAERICMPLTKKRDLMQALSAARSIAYNDAIAVAANEEQYDSDVDAPWTASRG